MIERLPAYGAGFLICLALLIIFHLLWKDAHRIVRYILGMGAVCTGCTVTGTVLNNADLAIGPWVITFAGLVIILWTWIEERAEKGRQDAQKNGELIGMTLGLTQDVIDRGGHNAQTRPGMDETRSRN